MQTYVDAELTLAEREVLARHFTSVDGPVAALIGLPETTKAALFARYSRTQKSIKRVFLDEFAEVTDETGSAAASVGLDRAADLFSRVLADYGDDSVAQLAGVHVSCEQVSNLLTKAIERGRLMGYLEQSTRYVFYGDKPGGQYRYYRDPEVLSGRHGETYISALDGLFDAYTQVFEAVKAMLQAPLAADDKAARSAARAAALDVARGILPAATVSNVGVFGSPQAFEQLVLRLRSHELPEARAYAELIVPELMKVIPDFLSRLNRPERGGVWTEYRASRAAGLEQAAGELGLAAGLPGAPVESSPGTRLLRWREDAEDAIVAAALYEHSDQPMESILATVKAQPAERRRELFLATVGERRNRRHRPGRDWEFADYEFEVVSDYGAFRHLQRHRLLTIEWQRLAPDLGYEVPAAAEEAGVGDTWRAAVTRAEEAYRAMRDDHPAQASYLVTMQHRIRYLIRMNAREAMHLVELRSSPQGHAAYRRVAQDMHALIRDVAGHRLVADAMQFVNREDVHLGRLEAERRLAERPEAAAEAH